MICTSVGGVNRNMVQALPNVYLASVRERRERTNDDSAKLYKLPPNHVDDLRDVARGVEETNAGVCCRYLIDQLASPGSSDVDDDGYVHHLEAVERFCDRFGVFKHPTVKTWRNRVTRCRRALSRMRAEGHAEHAAVLHVAFGYPDPITTQLVELSALGDLASLARYTQPVEDKRMQLVRAEALRRPLGDPPDLALARERQQHADKCLTSSDALRAALAPTHRAATESEEHFKERRTRDKHARAAFVLDVKLAAARMLSDAERVYHAAWFRSAV